MKRKMIFGIVLVMLLFLQVQIVFANDRQTTRLIQAVNRGNVSDARAALDRGANVNARFSNTTQTVLYGAVENRNLEMVRFLLERGADINARSSSNLTALHNAVHREHMDTVRYLVTNGINVNARDTEGRAALNIAFERGDMNIHAYLLANGAMEFEVTQAPQPAAPPPAQPATVIVQQPATPAQPAQTQQPPRNVGREIAEAFRSPLQSGTYSLAGTQMRIRISAIARSGILTFTNAQG